ncbi:MAG TPA: hypothetical protein PLM29_01915 [Deltaproteobacteria bacterium]|nr:hypothetical protein [Deltaproteobacteria bacterium]
MNELTDLREVLDWLIDKFRLERMVYLVATAISIIMLLVTAALIIIQKGATTEILILLFGSTGLIGYSVNRLMRMFDQILKVIASAQEEGGPGNG